MPSVQVDGAELHYEVFGRGPPFIFCAATATHGDVWKFYQTPEFSKDHQVIIFDQRGTGSSPATSMDFSTSRLAQDAIAILDRVEVGPAIVCGHSNGGRVAQCLALDFPDRVSKLILASSGTSTQTRGIPLSLCLGLVEHGYEGYVRRQSIETGFTKEFVAAHPEEVERFLAVRLGRPPSLEIFLRHVVARQEFDPGPRLKNLQVPTLVMIGDDEDHGAVSGVTHFASAMELAADIPNAKFVVLNGQGHYYYYSDSVTTNRIIREFIAD